MQRHREQVEKLQEELRAHRAPTAFRYGKRKLLSHTTRSRFYKKGKRVLDLGPFNRVLKVDPARRVATVEPRVTMEQLVKATLAHGLIPQVVPELKNLTVGGAIMGVAGESSSHRWGVFNDTCLSYELLCGDGTLLHISPSENADLFYGVAGSYGSLGALVQAEVQLMEAKEYVHVRYRVFSDPFEAIAFMRKLAHEPDAPDFIDAIILSPNRAVIMEGSLNDERGDLPLYSIRCPSAEWYYQHAQKIADRSEGYEEAIPLYDYLFRLDQGAFWMGGYIFRPSFFARALFEGVLRLYKRQPAHLSQEELNRWHPPQAPSLWARTLFYTFLTSGMLLRFCHLARRWFLDKFIIQDLCVREDKAEEMLEHVLNGPATFPLWSLPIKATQTEQIFSPHLLPKNEKHSHFINIGVYGLPGRSAPIEEITKKLEAATTRCLGRKGLYSRSYYTEEEFWDLYPRSSYEALRKKTRAKGVFDEITDKVLSE